jgi:hypothetical protein
MTAIRVKSLAFVLSVFTGLGVAHAGDTGIYHNGIYLPPKLPEWGEQHPESRPTKYLMGDMGHQFVNGRLIFFIVKDIKWNQATHEAEYVKAPAFGTKS